MKATQVLVSLAAAGALAGSILVGGAGPAAAQPCSPDSGCTHGKPVYQFCGATLRTVTWIGQGSDGWYVGTSSSGLEWTRNPAAIGDTTYRDGAPYVTKVRNAC